MKKKHENGAVNITLLFVRDYFREKRCIIFLYILTVAVFMIVGSFYHLENLSRLGYAGVLTAFFWLVAGVYDGRKYVERRRRIRAAGEYPENASLLLGRGDGIKAEGVFDEGEGEDGSTMEAAYVALVEALCEKDRYKERLWEEKSREQSDYYVMWAHQIKTPIAAMRLLLNGQQSGQKERFLMQEELFKIEQYVEMALHYQRLESMSSDMVLKEYDLCTLLKQAVKKYSISFINSGLKLKLEEMQMRIVTDDKWFGFCVEQILSNSIKYTAQAGVLEGREVQEGEILLYMHEELPDTLVISDNGIGIRKEDLPRIFERGFTGYNGRMDKKATGIGLYLTKRILDRLGNTIRVESTEGIGTKVYITLVTSQSFSNE